MELRLGRGSLGHKMDPGTGLENQEKIDKRGDRVTRRGRANNGTRHGVIIRFEKYTSRLKVVFVSEDSGLDHSGGR